jgi:DNA (cytosine-5)-methyltransferase 1
MVTVISTFAGCGGSSLGYRLDGFKELLAIDFDKNSMETFTLNFPETPVWQRDITTITGMEILDFCNIKKGELDVLDGSPPCQGFSTAGKRKVTDERNDLFKEYVQLIKELEPKCFVMENVSGQVKGKMKGKFIEILTTLKGLDYEVKVKLLNAANYGVPQSRQRLFYIAFRKDLNIIPQFPTPSNKILTMQDVLKDCPDFEDRPIKDWLKQAWYELKDNNGAKTFLKYKGTTGGHFSTKKLHINKPSRTLTKSEISVSGLLHPTKPRYLNAIELKRICSFPDDFKFINRKDLCERLGNSVMPLQMKAIAEVIKRQLE